MLDPYPRRLPGGLLICTALFLWVCAPVPEAAAQALPPEVDPSFRVTVAEFVVAGGADALTRLDLRRFEVRDPGRAVERVHRAVTIFRPEARERGRLVVGYDKMRRLRRLEGRIRDASGEVVRKLGKGDVEDYSAVSGFSLYEDNRVRVAELFHDVYPYTVEYEYELRYDGLISWPTWYPQWEGDPLVYGRLEVTMPAAVVARHAGQGGAPEPQAWDDDGRRTLQWTVEYLPAFEREPYGPPASRQTLAVYTAPTAFEVEDSRGDMRTWEGFGRWYAGLARGRDVLPPEAARLVQDLVADAPDDREKARRLYAYLQEKTRYVSVQLGLGGWQPFDARYVHERSYGDCKALTNYLLAMLREAGLEAYPALIRNGVGAPDLRADFPSNQFNHVVAFVPMEADTLWLESTSQTIPFGHLGASNEDRYTLVVKEAGSELVRTPRSRSTDNLQARRARIVLAEDGSARAEVQTRYTGNQQNRLRGTLAHASARERTEWLHRAIDLPTFHVTEADFSSLDERRADVALPLTLEMPRYAARTGARLFFTPTLMGRWTDVPPPDTTARAQPVEFFGYAFADADTMEYVLPEGFTVEALPDPVAVEAPFGRFHAEASLTDAGTLRYSRWFEITETSAPADQYETFRAFLSRVATSDRAQAVLVRR